ncbi:hypothetical protein QAD02_003519 [Eretmocerus hayati]|uniref:Uncharacterized protein n=1 Tax=Eretmocerus hayati TaxID=131215 RepID=A0ACC2NM49_9HYME|nr:hypothetical protein QAD02_003519 [Eretmocerus hayati]
MSGDSRNSNGPTSGEDGKSPTTHREQRSQSEGDQGGSQEMRVETLVTNTGMVYTASRPELVFITPSERRLGEDLRRAQHRANNWVEAFKEATQAMLAQRDELRVQAEQFQAASSEAQREREELRQTARELADLLSSRQQDPELTQDIRRSEASGQRRDNAVSDQNPRRSEASNYQVINSTPIATNFRISQVRQSHRDATNQNDCSRVENLEVPALNVSDTLVNELNAILLQVNSTSKSSNSGRVSVKRVYKLTHKAPYDLWLDSLKSELQTLDLLGVIDSNVPAVRLLTAQEIQKRKIVVRDIIINHIDSHHQKRIINVKDPVDILRELMLIRRSEVKLTDTSVKTKLYRLRMRQNESVNQFCDRFDDSIREHEMCGTKPLDESDNKAMSYQAVSDNSRDVRISELIINALNKDMFLSEMKNIMLQFEASDRSRINSDVRANSAQTHERCHRTARQGHLWASCSLAGRGPWYCYFCKDDVPHNGNDPNCPQRNNPRDGYVPANLNQNRSKNGKFSIRGSRGGIAGGRGGRVGEKKVPQIPTPGKEKRQGQERGRLRLAEVHPEVPESFSINDESLKNSDDSQDVSPAQIEPEVQKSRGRQQKRENDEKSPLEADAKQRKNPERQVKTNRPTWSHLRLTEVETPPVDICQATEWNNTTITKNTLEMTGMKMKQRRSRKQQL